MSTESAVRNDQTAALSDEELLAVFQPVFDRIAVDAVEREQQHRLPSEEIGWLREAGFGRLRVPRAAGGFGVSLAQLVLLLIRLGEADSNIPQALRGHIGFAEFVLAHADADYRAFWFEQFVAGALVGNAESERAGSFGAQVTEVTGRPGSYRLNGAKFYTTGSLFADWIFVSAAQVDPQTGARGLVSVQVPTGDPGVQITDDWDGFGQQLTASGTTTFTDVPVEDRFVHVRDTGAFTRTITNAVYQLVHLGALAGIGRAALRDIQEFQRTRTRNIFNPAVAPTADPVALQVIGATYGLVETVTAAVLAAAATVQSTSDRQLAGTATEADFARADAHVYGVQGTVIELVLRLVSGVFEVGGASATSRTRALDRLWRNARTISSHNPAIYRQQAVGDWLLNGVAPSAGFLSVLAKDPALNPQN